MTDAPHNEKREIRVKAVLAEAPESVKGCLKRAFSGSGGRTNAIKAMCLACVGYDREAIRNCTGFSCPLWKYRPFTGNSKWSAEAALERQASHPDAKIAPRPSD